MLMPGVDTFFSTQAFSFSEICKNTLVLCLEQKKHNNQPVNLANISSVVAHLSSEWLLTIENNNIELPVAERLVLVGDAGPEAARPPERQPQQNLALLLVE